MSTITRLATVAMIGLVAPLFGCASVPRSFAEPPPGFVRAPLEIAPRSMEPARDYRIGPHDVLTLRVYELEEPGEVVALDLEVSNEGEVGVPYVGLIRAAGSTVAEVHRAIAEALGARYLVDPQVTLGVKEYRSRMIAVTGSVARPGVLYLNRNRVSLVEALSLAGGLSKEAGTRAFVLRPKDPARSAGEMESTKVDLVAAILGNDPASDIEIEPGMVIQVPAAEEFYVMGYVRRAGAFPYQRPTTVLQAIATAGGLDALHALPSVVTIKRVTGAGVEVIQVDLDSIAAGEDPDVAIRPGDSIDAGRTMLRAVVMDVLDALRGFFGIGIAAAPV